MSIWSWLGLERQQEPEDRGPLAEIEQALGGLEPDRAHYVACFAYILTRAARADHEVTDGEAREMERLVALRADLPIEVAGLIVQITRALATRSGGTDDFLVTREFDRIATHEQKLALIDCLFAVSSSDESILTAEDNEIRRIANELKIEHSEYIAVRTGHLKHLSVFKPREQG
ncbi:MAG: hypothetical protein A3H96_21030 [Acidobacteria bacterium RIFCSPLOWO2_02_FULL_67_36]|nr:MAG: hypothetical protein A3H96_21030 [Acidobacteria bacterium RIFCSPLOWO2_02_FULL_67_36]OFW21918.1 MAG: hypothetical protein A3G21_08600 [Acidobacteria bacterium RIFCSPLOWO2_12_FULL_66_21]